MIRKLCFFSNGAMYAQLRVFMFFLIFGAYRCAGHDATSEEGRLSFKQNPAPDGHRCGVCPTYIQKICAYDFNLKSTHIFDNHCIMDMFNCRDGTHYVPVQYNKCLYFGNFAYVHGFKYEDMDYGEDHIIVKGSKKNPNFVAVM